MVTVVRMMLGLVAVAVAGVLLQPVAEWLAPIGAWALALWLGLLLVVSYVVLAAFDWIIGGMPSPRHRPRSTRQPHP
jgi:hypothetical protein